MKRFPKLFRICGGPGRRLVFCFALLGLAYIFFTLKAGAAESSFVEGTVTQVRPIPGGHLELQMASGTNQFAAEVLDGQGNAPILSSRLRVPGRLPRPVVPRLEEIVFLTGYSQPLVTNVAGLHRLGAMGQHAGCVVYLQGLVLAVGQGGRTLVLQDDSGVVLLEMKIPGAAVAPGQKIILNGNGSVEGDRVWLFTPPVVDNNDIHSMLERSGAVFLTAGKHPFRLVWFNQKLPYGLEVYFQGPDLPRQKIPDSVLLRRETNSFGERWVNGVDYRCCEGYWLRVPDLDRVAPATTGSTANFNLSVLPRADEIAAQFSGALEVPRNGIYTFSTISDDGSLMFFDEAPPVIEIAGTNTLPTPMPVGIRQNLAPDQDGRWAQVEGTVTMASELGGELHLELSSDAGRMRVEVADATGATPSKLLNHRIRATGICFAARTVDNQNIAGTLLAPGARQLEPAERSAETTANVSGSSANLPVLTTVEQIKRLTRAQWQRGYPVKICGVVTTVLDSGFFIQDATRSIYARWWPPTDRDWPRVGEFWEIEGATFAEFAPNIQVSHATRLGVGALPEPLRPTWDQLINGSLDTELVEIQGIITAVGTNDITLLTRGGSIILQLPDWQSRTLAAYQNALVRVRGCVMPVRDLLDRQFVPGQLRLCNAAISVDEPAPADWFAVPLKHAADLLQFDAAAGAFQRVKVSGQLVHVGDDQLFLMDGRDGLRVFLKTPDGLKVGDLVEVAGFPDLNGPSPRLREAVVHQTGNAGLPKPEALPAETPLDRKFDATLVQVQARLVTLNRDRSEQTLEMQLGTREFVARLKNRAAVLPEIRPGSLLNLTGVYAGQGSDWASGREINSFELLLNSAADVKVLAQPSWWTVRHTLTALGCMALAVLAALVWIALLRRQVEERSSQLAAEIRRHEQTERQRELEAERSRIARDLHDDLGATLTQIRFLSAIESRDAQLPETTRGRMEQVSEKSREMVESLDEIVWAVNPANDSLPNVANYLCHFADEFFRATPIRCRLDVADDLPAAPLTSEVRHNLYLAVREALNNIAKHSHATEVWLRIRVLPPDQFCIAIEDNGRGLAPAAPAGDGLANMRQRLQTIGGRFDFESQPGAGVACRLVLPLPKREA